MIELADVIRIGTPIIAAVVVVVSMKSTQTAIISRLDSLERNIEKAHDRLDKHIVEWHKA